ncbi:MAG: class IV adenylate cyclase [Bacteroidota bacterium]
MPQNVELKAPVASIKEVEKIARRLRARRVGILHQTDTYYAVPHGRLKLREFREGTAELIFYTRPNKKGGRISDYSVVPLRSPAEMKQLLGRIYKVKEVVRKQRTLYLFKNARIHLDRVDGLGQFIEFEVVVSRGKKQAQKLFEFLREEFGIGQRTIAGSYSDLMKSRRRRK